MLYLSFQPIMLLEKEENKYRILNEWQWHKVAYMFGYGGDAPKNANIDLYEPDSEHGPLSWIMNNVHIY